MRRRDAGRAQESGVKRRGEAEKKNTTWSPKEENLNFCGILSKEERRKRMGDRYEDDRENRRHERDDRCEDSTA